MPTPPEGTCLHPRACGLAHKLLTACGSVRGTQPQEERVWEEDPPLAGSLLMANNTLKHTLGTRGERKAQEEGKEVRWGW